MERTLGSLAFSLALSSIGYMKRSLSVSGAVAAIVVGFVTCEAGVRFAAVLLWFFVSCSLLTRHGKERKRKIEHDYKEGGQRDYQQVLANGGVGTLCAALYHWLLASGRRDWALFAFLGHYAACQGDTWASELGTAHGPLTVRLVTQPWRRVPAGTNGGVSFVGSLAALLGGLSLGVAFALADALGDGGISSGGSSATTTALERVLFGAALCTCAALLGTTLDSLLGATLQLSLWDDTLRRIVSRASASTKHVSGVDVLNNHQVNFLSALLTALATPTLASLLAQLFGRDATQFIN